MRAFESLPQRSIHECTVKDYGGEDVDLSIYKGKVLLVDSVASKCGFTYANYNQLTEVHNKYQGRASAEEDTSEKLKCEYKIIVWRLHFMDSCLIDKHCNKYFWFDIITADGFFLFMQNQSIDLGISLKSVSKARAWRKPRGTRICMHKGYKAEYPIFQKEVGHFDLNGSSSLC
ncbi:hypothetical protein SLEP1_g36958 [Rubroshorea leprosula]|uniref:Glutathione peroxidase n=1 Tax=Rubroshorea leprosula TaxID=152421 RepID=A0AAV5KT58_9ROSI|nr:hypothetical protein SLEP1_g36958 [Rubroshorea leprosula]